MLTTNAKLILTNFLIQINIYQYLTVIYQYLVNAYKIKPIFNSPWPIFNQLLQTCNSKPEPIAWIGAAMEIHNPLNRTDILSPNKKAARYAGFKNGIFYKWILIFL